MKNPVEHGMRKTKEEWMEENGRKIKRVNIQNDVWTTRKTLKNLQGIRKNNNYYKKQREHKKS